MALLLGIDGGGTGCRAAVADASGRILGEAVAGPANIASDLDGARANILTAARLALAKAVGDARVDDELPALAAGLGLAGANAAGAAGRLHLALPFTRIKVATDGIAAVMGALGPHDGIVAALGTGSVFARQQGGEIRQIGGWGLALGDEGSGAHLGRGLLRAAVGAAEGFRPMTPLLQAVLAEHGGKEGVIAYSLTARPADYATLAPRILASADPVAMALLQSAAEDIAGSIVLLQTADTLPVTFIGGLGPAFETRLAGHWSINPALGTALDGALLLAREVA